MATNEDTTISIGRSFKLEDRYSRKLLSHQCEGLSWFMGIHNTLYGGGILADDMGTGKTRQVCAFLKGLFSSNMVEAVLLVVPSTLIYHWKNELGDMGLSRNITERGAPAQEKFIHLVSYSTELEPSLSKTHWDYLIMDEGHLVRGQSHKAARWRFIERKHCILVTGAPIQNKLEDLWDLMNFCKPGLLPKKEVFKKVYNDAITEGDSQLECSTASHKLKQLIRNFILRRTKRDVFTGDMTLPQKEDIVVWLRLTKGQRKLYRSYLKSYSNEESIKENTFSVAAKLQRICNNPEDLELEDAERGCKLMFVNQLVVKLLSENHNVLIFARSSFMRAQIEKLLEPIAHPNGRFKVFRLDGNVATASRSGVVMGFNKRHDGPRVLLSTPEVGGCGINLTHADRVIVVEPSWNPSSDDQCVERAYTIGQNKDVVAYRLITCGTIEETVYRKQVHKSRIARTIMEDKEVFEYFGEEDGLFAVPESRQLKKSDTRRTLRQRNGMSDSIKSHGEYIQRLPVIDTLGVVEGVSDHGVLFETVLEGVRSRKDVLREQKLIALKEEHKHNIASHQRLISKAKLESLPDKGAKLHTNLENFKEQLEGVERELNELRKDKS